MADLGGAGALSRRVGAVLVLLWLVAACGDGQQGAATSASSAQWVEEDLTFTFDGDELFGVLTLPSGQGPHPAIVIVRGSGQGGVSSQYLTDHARAFAENGFAALRYDPPGVGRSTGTSRYQTLQTRVEEVMAAVVWLQSRPDIATDRVGLWGESQGGWVIAMAAADHPEDVAFMISVSGSGVSVAEQQIYNIEAESRAAGLSEQQVAMAVLFGRLLIDWQVVEPLYRRVNEDAMGDLGSGPWDLFAPLVYEPGALTAAENLQAGIAILESVQDEPWAEFLRLRELYIPALQSIPPEQAAFLKAVTGPDLIRSPRDAMARVLCPVLAFFGEDDVVQPTERSAALYAQYLAEAGNQDFEIVVIPGVGHSIDLSMAPYAGALSDWLGGLFGE